MEPVALHKRVIGLDIHQAQVTACAADRGIRREFIASCSTN